MKKTYQFKLIAIIFMTFSHQCTMRGMSHHQSPRPKALSHSLETVIKKINAHRSKSLRSWQRLCWKICASDLELPDKKSLLDELYHERYDQSVLSAEQVDFDHAQHAPLIIWSVCMGYNEITEVMLTPKIHKNSEEITYPVMLDEIDALGSAVYHAVRLNNIPILKKLIDAGASAHQVGSHFPSLTPLHLAIIKHNLAAVKILIPIHPYLYSQHYNYQNNYGTNALDLACYEQSKYCNNDPASHDLAEIIKLLRHPQDYQHGP